MSIFIIVLVATLLTVAARVAFTLATDEGSEDYLHTAREESSYVQTNDFSVEAALWFARLEEVDRSTDKSATKARA